MILHVVVIVLYAVLIAVLYAIVFYYYYSFYCIMHRFYSIMIIQCLLNYTLWYFIVCNVYVSYAVLNALYAVVFCIICGYLVNTVVIVLNSVVFCTYTCTSYTFAYKTLLIML